MMMDASGQAVEAKITPGSFIVDIECLLLSVNGVSQCE